MQKIFFIDIDDTLLPVKHNSQISEKNKKAIKILQQKGYIIFLATGKSISMMKDVAQELNIANYITSNGNVISINNKIIYEKPLDREDILEVQKSITKHENIFLGGQGNDSTYVLCDDQQLYSKYVEPLFDKLSVNLPIQTKKFQDNIYQLWLLGELENLELKSQDKFDYIRWNKSGYDVIYKGVSKASAIEYILAKYYCYEEIETYGFGDGLNDLKMLQLVNHGIAMSTGHEKLQHIANYVADNSTNEGIYNYLKEKQII